MCSIGSTDTSNTQTSEIEQESDPDSYYLDSLDDPFPTSCLYIQESEYTRSNMYRSAENAAHLFLTLPSSEISNTQALHASLSNLCDKLDETMDPFSLREELLNSKQISISPDLEKSPLLRRRRATISSNVCLSEYSRQIR